MTTTLSAGCSGDDDTDDTSPTTTDPRTTQTTSTNNSTSDLDIVEVDVVATPDEHEPVIAAAAQVAGSWFTAAWESRSHEEGDNWIAQLGHPDPDVAEKLLTGPTVRADDPDEVQAADYWADIRAVLWNGAEVPEDQRWLDDVDGTEVFFATAVGRTDEPALIARDHDGALQWVQVPVAVEAGISGLRPDGSRFNLRIYVQGDLELRPLDASNETQLGITWLDASESDERQHLLRIRQEDTPATTPVYLTED